MSLSPSSVLSHVSSPEPKRLNHGQRSITAARTVNNGDAELFGESNRGSMRPEHHRFRRPRLEEM